MFILLLSLFSLDALECVCSDCTLTGDTCTGEICYSKVIIGVEPGAEPVYTQGCYFNVQASNCNRSSDWHTTLCCESDHCNADLHPMLSSGDSSTSSADYLSSTELFSSTEDDENSNSEPTVIGKHK